MSSNELVYERHMALIHKTARKWKFLRLTTLEFIFAFSFILNFIVGKLLHVFSQKEEVYNYYNDKGNIFNQWFVKKGWAWTTGAIALFYTIEVSKSGFRLKVLRGAVLRWLVATCWWYLFTQWCFGLPIMDKVFVLTGGKCASVSAEKLARLTESLHLFTLVDGVYESSAISSSQCRRLKGSWEGGHDPLGHVFLLVHSSLYMFHEIKPFWPGWKSLYRSIIRFTRNTNKDNVMAKSRALVVSNPSILVLGLLGLWWFMLLMTNMYFHSLAEKLVGLVFGYIAVAAVYWLPRWM